MPWGNNNRLVQAPNTVKLAISKAATKLVLAIWENATGTVGIFLLPLLPVF